MPIFRVAESGNFVPFEKTPFPDLERALEDWIESNPHMLLEGENIAIVARQPRSMLGKYLDLLGIDASGACVVVELKRGETPRDVVAQTLEYAAWVDSLNHDQLDELARAYAAQRGLGADGAIDVYRNAFSLEAADDLGASPALADRITLNNRQRMIVVAESFSEEVEQTLRYLPTRLGVDITGLQFSVHRAGGETIIETNAVVGRERAAAASEKSPGRRESEPHDSIIARAKTDFVRKAVNMIEDWIDNVGHPDLAVRHGPGTEHFIRLNNKSQVYYYFAYHWIYAYLYAATATEIETLRAKLTKPEEVRETSGSVRFHLARDADFEVLKELILARIAAPGNT